MTSPGSIVLNGQPQSAFRAAVEDAMPVNGNGEAVYQLRVRGEVTPRPRKQKPVKKLPGGRVHRYRC